MNPVSVDIKDLLVADGVGVFTALTGWSIFIGQEPTSEDEAPHTVITIYDITGDPDDTLNGIEVDDFSIQVRVRGIVGDYLLAHTKIKEVVASLNQKKDYITGSTRYASIYRSTIPFFAKRDDQNRPIWLCNFGGLRTTN